VELFCDGSLLLCDDTKGRLSSAQGRSRSGSSCSGVLHSFCPIVAGSKHWGIWWRSQQGAVLKEKGSLCIVLAFMFEKNAKGE
jgi:hypothetical protein